MKTLNFNDFNDFGTKPAKDGNFAESGEFDKNSQHFHITDFWVNLKNDESREIFTYETREMDSALPLHLLVGVDL